MLLILEQVFFSLGTVDIRGHPVRCLAASLASQLDAGSTSVVKPKMDPDIAKCSMENRVSPGGELLKTTLWGAGQLAHNAKAPTTKHGHPRYILGLTHMVKGEN